MMKSIFTICSLIFIAGVLELAVPYQYLDIQAPDTQSIKIEPKLQSQSLPSGFNSTSGTVAYYTTTSCSNGPVTTVFRQ